MPEIIPIRDLKNTNAISQRCHETAEPIFVTGALGLVQVRNSLPETPCVQVRQLLLRSHAARHPCGHKAKERFAYEEKHP